MSYRLSESDCMTSAIFYGSTKKLTNAHKPVHTEGGSIYGGLKHGGHKQSPYFVRMKYFKGDTLTALHKSKPLEGEIVLNTVELDLSHDETKRKLIAEVRTSCAR